MQLNPHTSVGWYVAVVPPARIRLEIANLHDTTAIMVGDHVLDDNREEMVSVVRSGGQFYTGHRPPGIPGRSYFHVPMEVGALGLPPVFPTMDHPAPGHQSGGVDIRVDVYRVDVTATSDIFERDAHMGGIIRIHVRSPAFVRANYILNPDGSPCSPPATLQIEIRPKWRRKRRRESDEGGAAPSSAGAGASGSASKVARGEEEEGEITVAKEEGGVVADAAVKVEDDEE